MPGARRQPPSAAVRHLAAGEGPGAGSFTWGHPLGRQDLLSAFDVKTTPSFGHLHTLVFEIPDRSSAGRASSPAWARPNSRVRIVLWLLLMSTNMEESEMLRFRLFPCLMLIVTFAATAATAYAQDDDRWHLRFGGVWVDRDARLSAAGGEGSGVEVGTDGAIGFALALERRLTRRLGLELGALIADPDVELDTSRGVGASRLGIGEGVDLRSITLGLNVHLTPDQAVDLYAGPLLAHVDYGNLRFAGQAGEETFDIGVSGSDSFTIGAQIGADIPLGGSRWSVNLLARYLDSSLDVVSGEEREVRQLNYDPLILGAGVGLRF